MGDIDCLKVCSECSRHVRCSERTCPFCGTALTFFMRVADYRLNTRLGRGATAALGAALGAAGFVMGCSDNAPRPLYGLACSPPSCTFPVAGDTGTGGSGFGGGGMSSAGTGGINATSGGIGGGGTSGSGATSGGTAGGNQSGGGAGVAGEGGAAGAGEEPGEGGAAGR